jgi:hypothetical protein
MLQGLGVTEANWRDAGKKDPNFLESESPLYVGRTVAALAGDPKVLEQTGQILSSWEVARRYGFTDYDGRRPDWGNWSINWSAVPPPLAELLRTSTALQLAWSATLTERTRRFFDKLPQE